MTKALWVVLPIGAFTIWVIARRVASRPLTRHALNVQQATLLLVYFAVTSGLGIFWVANQQLPVFDLHYLFGYATVLLVAAHFLINWKLVRGYFTGPSKPNRAAAVGHAHARPKRGSPWGLAGGAAALACSFWLGMRYGGGTTLTATWQGGDVAPVAQQNAEAPGVSGAGPVDVIEQYHAMSSHDRVGLITRAPSVDWGDAPAPFKSYPSRPTVALPRLDADAGSGRSVSEALVSGPARTVARLDLPRLAMVLQYSVGVTTESGGFLLRAAPSSGALFPTELYVLARDVDGLEPATYHYDPQHHRLTRLADAPGRPADVGVVDRLAGRAPAVIALTSIFRRTGYKYRDRAYRYATADAGHALQNVLTAAGEAGLHARPLARFDEARAAAALGVDGVEEGVLALVPLDLGAPPPAGAVAREFRWPEPPDAKKELLGVTSVVHLATSLRLAEPRAEAGDAVVASAQELPEGAIRLPPPVPGWGEALPTIAARRSERRFPEARLTLEELSSMLRYAAGAEPVLSGAVRTHVVVHAVEGVEPGAYRYDAPSQALVPSRRGNFRAASESAALSQEVIGRAAVVFVLTLDRSATFAADGARGYRHGFLEAGMLGERLYLDAGGRGLGACAVGAFYDAEAAQLIGVDPAKEWVVHFCGVGRRSE